MIDKIKGAIFDMDGTLIDSLMIWDVMWEKFGERFCNGQRFQPTDAEEKAIRTMTLVQAMDYLYGIYGIGNSSRELLEAANEIIEYFYANEVLLKEGVLEFLESCRQRQIKMCIASATDRRLLNIVIRHCGIGEYFDKIVSCAELGKGKEEPDIYLKALEELGTKKEETCVFEDSLVAIRTADKIGLRTVGIYDKYNFGQAEIQKIATVYIAEGETLGKLLA